MAINSSLEGEAGSNRIARIFKVAGKVLLASGFSKLCLVGVEFFLAAFLGPTDYGLFSIAFAFLLVFSSLTQFGLEFGVIQYMSIYTETSEQESKVSVARVSLLFVSTISVACGISVIYSANWLATAIFNQADLAPLLVLVGAIVPFEALNQNFSAIFRGLREFRYHVLALDLVRNVSLLLSVPVALMGQLDVYAVFYVLAVGSGIGTLISLLVLTKRLKVWRKWQNEWSVFRQLISFSYLLFIWQAMQKTANELMVLIAGIVLIPAEVGILALAVRFLSLLNFPQSVVNAITPVEFARLNHRQEFQAITRLFQMLAIILTLIAITFALVVGLNAEIIFTIFGSGYQTFGWVLEILLLAKVVDVGLGPVGHILIACRRRKSVLSIGLLDVALQFVLVVPLMVTFGLFGAVIGNVIRSLTIVISRHAALYLSLHVYALSRILFVIAALGFGAYAVGAFLIRMTSGVGLQIILSFTVLMIVPLAIFYMWKVDKQMIITLRHGFMGR